MQEQYKITNRGQMWSTCAAKSEVHKTQFEANMGPNKHAKSEYFGAHKWLEKNPICKMKWEEEQSHALTC